MAPHVLPRRRSLRLMLVVSLLAMATLAVLVGRASTGSAQAFTFMYSAKYECVNEVGPPSSMVINQGAGITYRTVVNIHNPTNTVVQIGKKAAQGTTENQQPGKISPVKNLALLPDQVLAIDCRDINTLLVGPLASGDGMVVVFSTASLDVWAVYTMRGTLTSGGSSIGINGNIDVVQVPERRIG